MGQLVAAAPDLAAEALAHMAQALEGDGTLQHEGTKQFL